MKYQPEIFGPDLMTDFIDPTDFFRAHINVMIDRCNPPAVLATRMPRDQIESAIAPRLKRPVHTGQDSVVVHLFCTTAEIFGTGTSSAALPPLPIGPVVSLLYFKRVFGLSDAAEVECLVQDVLFQLLSGQQYFEHRLPCDSNLVRRFRKDRGKGRLEKMLKITIDAAV